MEEDNAESQAGSNFQQSSSAQSMFPMLQQQQNQQAAPQSKYAQLLVVIEEIGLDIRPSYAGNKSSAERLKRGLVHARILVRECLMETERSARQ
jgi:hypothetical protein